MWDAHTSIHIEWREDGWRLFEDNSGKLHRLQQKWVVDRSAKPSKLSDSSTHSYFISIQCRPQIEREEINGKNH